jgi:hypothetical protein
MPNGIYASQHIELKGSGHPDQHAGGFLQQSADFRSHCRFKLNISGLQDGSLIPDCQGTDGVMPDSKRDTATLSSAPTDTGKHFFYNHNQLRFILNCTLS